MSWKGLKKAVNRLPHIVQTKTGSVEQTVDQEFDYWNSQLEELDQLSVRLHDAAKKYKSALAAMLKHQESFAKTLVEVYEPIQGRYQSTSPVSPVGSYGTFGRKQRPTTPESSLKRAQDFYQVSKEMGVALVPQLDVVIERQVIKPSNDFALLHKQVQKTIQKRNNKKIDFDRHNNQLKRMREKMATPEDERKAVKMESTVENSRAEYERFNDLLKSQLPVYVQLRMEFMDPILHAMVFFQDSYFQSLYIHLEPMKKMVDMSLSAVEGYEAKKDGGLALIEEISIIRPSSPVKRSMDNMSELDNDEFDSDTKQSSVPSKSPVIPTAASAPPMVAAKPGHLQSAKQAPPPPLQKRPPVPPLRKARVLFDFEAQQQGDLTIKTGQVVEIVESGPDTNAWWLGRCNGREGSFPGNYVELM